MLRIEPKIRAAVALSLTKYLESHGHDFKSLLRSSGIPIEDIRDPMTYVPLRRLVNFYAAAARKIGDCGLPLKVAEVADVGNTGLIGHLAMASPTVRAFLECLAGYAPILATGLEVGFTTRDDTAELFWIRPAGFEAPSKPYSLFFAASVVFRVRQAAGPAWVPMEVTFEHKASSATPEEAAVFGPRVTFNADRTSIWFDAKTLALPMPSVNDQLFEIFKHHAALLLREVRDERDLVAKVRDALVERMGGEDASLERIAADLAMKPRSLQRQLEQMGTSFESILDETRSSVAERLLRETNRPLIEIAQDVGYASQSALTRAVRRWLHVSPSAYRARFRATTFPREIDDIAAGVAAGDDHRS